MTRNSMSKQSAIAVSQGIYQILMCLGISANYAGFGQTAYAVSLAMQDPDRLTLVSKRLYPEVAERYGVTWLAVSRNISTVAKVAWQKNPRLLSELAGRELVERPKAAQFVSSIVFHLLKETGNYPDIPTNDAPGA